MIQAALRAFLDWRWRRRYPGLVPVARGAPVRRAPSWASSRPPADPIAAFVVHDLVRGAADFLRKNETASGDAP